MDTQLIILIVVLFLLFGGGRILLEPPRARVRSLNHGDLAGFPKGSPVGLGRIGKSLQGRVAPVLVDRRLREQPLEKESPSWVARQTK